MPGITRSVVAALAVAIAASATPGGAVEYAPNLVRAENSDAGTSPRYLQHDERNIRPLNGAETYQGPPQGVDALAPRLRSAERLVSNPPQMGARLAEPQTLAASNGAIPLGPAPSEGSPSRSRGVSALANGALSLGIVLGLFLVVAWAVRRGMPKGSGQLPREAVEVLGRAPLIAKQQVHLVRCGNKLLLVCVMPGAVETLTEITDPAEVRRLAELCRGSTAGAAASFREVFQQVGARHRDRYYDERHDTGYGALGTDADYTREAAV